MNMIEFINRFSNEEACMADFRGIKEKDVIVCDQCGSILNYLLGQKLRQSVRIIKEDYPFVPALPLLI